MKTIISIFLIVPLLMFLSGRSFSQSVSAAPTAIQPGGEITVNWSGAPWNATDWIGLYPESAPSDRSWLTWKYTEGAKSGQITFTAPQAPGEYNFRFFENDGYRLLYTGNTLTVR